MRFFRSSRGDTIVEVLISIAVLSLILSASYALANKSSQAVRQAQERSEALKLSESQLESLKAYLSDPGVSVQPKYFCLYQDNQGDNDPANDVLVSQIFTGGQFPPDILDDDQFTSYPDQCKSGTDGRYHTFVKKEGDKYFAAIRWPRVNGEGNDEVSILYKLYEAGSGSALDLTTLPSGETATGSCPTNYELAATGNCEKIPPSITVTVKKVQPGAGNTTPPCSNSTTDKQGTSVTLNPGSLSGTTDANSNISFTRLQFSQPYTASYSVPSNYQACGSTSSGVTTDETPNANYTIPFVIRPICTGSLTTVPVYEWRLVHVGWAHTGWHIGAYYRSAWHTTSAFGYGLVFINDTPHGHPNAWRWWNSAIPSRGNQSLYDYYDAYPAYTPIYEWHYIHVSNTTVDTRSCPP